MYGLTLVTPPAEEPVSLAELKDWLRQEGSGDNPLIAALGVAARRACEQLLGRQLVTATWRLTLPGFPWPGGWAHLAAPLIHPDPHTIRLPKAPLQSVTSVQYYDMANALQALASTVYDVDAAQDPGRITLGQAQVWPVTRLRPDAVRVTFVAGHGAAAAVPETTKLAIKMLAAFWYEHRGESAEARPVPQAVRALLDSEWNGEREYGL